ncbi:hypothetical protein, partial [Mycobacterium paragordonae]|uniref:hypothetical protein n=1 Tax=Mycobacterium paragordonae TaxID=1389713 RepID=UPI001E421EB3
PLPTLSTCRYAVSAPGEQTRLSPPRQAWTWVSGLHPSKSTAQQAATASLWSLVATWPWVPVVPAPE